jgi:hypothetical protein
MPNECMACATAANGNLNVLNWVHERNHRFDKLTAAWPSVRSGTIEATAHVLQHTVPTTASLSGMLVHAVHLVN